MRYRFHTRNMELEPLIKKLSRAERKLTFSLVTHCLDDGDFGAFSFTAGKQRGKWLGDAWREPFWQQTAERLKITVDDAYEDEYAETVAENLMRDEAMKIATGFDRTYDWAGERVYRDLFDEQAEAMHNIALALTEVKDD